MAASLEETLILVWRQVMVEDTRVVALGEEKFPVRRTTDLDCGKWAFNLKGTNCGALNRTLKRALGGPGWRSKERR